MSFWNGYLCLFSASAAAAASAAVHNVITQTVDDENWNENFWKCLQAKNEINEDYIKIESSVFVCIVLISFSQ